MNNSRYRIILYFIVTVILSTIAIQVYWNYKNYLANKQQLIKDVQVSLDKAVDDYYVNLAEQTTIGFAFESDYKEDFFAEDHKFDSILKQIDITQKKFKNLDSLNLETTDGISIYRGANVDSILNAKWDHKKLNSIDIKKDSIKVKGFELLTSKVVISIPLSDSSPRSVYESILLGCKLFLTDLDCLNWIPDKLRSEFTYTCGDLKKDAINIIKQINSFKEKNDLQKFCDRYPEFCRDLDYQEIVESYLNIFKKVNASNTI